MRQIIFDTETTGIKPKEGHRIIELACLELVDGKATGNNLHFYINPEGKEIEAEALSVHGITPDFLKDKPTFREIAPAFVNFVRGAEILAHNADFDVDFVNAEFERLQMPPLWDVAAKITCTLKMAKSIEPSKRASLDVLCQRYGVDNSGRTLHGALLDCELLAEVYLKMNESAPPFIDDEETAKLPRPPVQRITETLSIPAFLPSAEDEAAHEKYLDFLSAKGEKKVVWQTEKKPSPRI